MLLDFCTSFFYIWNWKIQDK